MPEPTSRTVLTKTTRDGRSVTVTVETDPANTEARVLLAAYVDGQRAASSTGLARHAALPAGAVAAVGKVAFTVEEAAQIEAALEATKAALPRDLRAERRALVSQVHATEGTWTDARAAAHNDGDLNQHFAHREEPLKAAADQARAELDDFDGQHPEVAEAIRAEKEEQRRIRAELSD